MAGLWSGSGSGPAGFRAAESVPQVFSTLKTSSLFPLVLVFGSNLVRLELEPVQLEPEHLSLFLMVLK